MHAAIRVAHQFDLVPIALDLGVLADLAVVVCSAIFSLLRGKREPGRAFLILVELGALRLYRRNIQLRSCNRPVLTDTAFDDLEFLGLHPRMPVIDTPR